MEHYATYPHANMCMTHTPALRQALLNLFKSEPIDAVIETGTYQGEGSTNLLAQCIRDAGRLIPIHTIEANAENWSKARKNTEAFGFVTCHLGSSVFLQDAEQFLFSDEMLLNHEKYNGVYIDGLEPGHKMAAGYLSETMGSWSDDRHKQNLLADLVVPRQDRSLLIVLDSAGGLGWLEFQTVLRLMEGKSFHLMLDDCHHIKHFRSAKHVRDHAERFQILASEESWLLAKAL